MNLNAVMLTGNLTSDPELRHTRGGTAVCSMRIAVNGREKVGENWQDRADFFDIVAYGNQGENCVQYLKRGSPIGVSGRLRLEQWEKDGQKHSRVKIVARDVQFLPSGNRGGQQQQQSSGDFSAPDDFGGGSGSDDFAAAATDDDIPF